MKLDGVEVDGDVEAEIESDGFEEFYFSKISGDSCVDEYWMEVVCFFYSFSQSQSLPVPSPLYDLSKSQPSHLALYSPMSPPPPLMFTPPRLAIMRLTKFSTSISTSSLIRHWPSSSEIHDRRPSQ